MELTKCPTCGSELTSDMKLAQMCFVCGNELPSMPEEIKTKLEQEQIDYDQIIEEIKAEEAENKKRQQEQLQENNRILSVGKQHLMKSLQNINYRYLEINGCVCSIICNAIWITNSYRNLRFRKCPVCS